MAENIKMEAKTLLIIGGFYHIGWALFDATWPWLFQWKQQLKNTDDINKVLPYITSRLLIIVYLAISFISFFHIDELQNSRIGKTFCIFVSLYWISRAVMQIQYFGFSRANQMIPPENSPFKKITEHVSNSIMSLGFFVYFLLGSSLYVVPIFLSDN